MFGSSSEQKSVFLVSLPMAHLLAVTVTQIVLGSHIPEDGDAFDGVVQENSAFLRASVTCPLKEESVSLDRTPSNPSRSQHHQIS